MSAATQPVIVTPTSSAMVDRWIVVLAQWCERLRARRVLHAAPEALLNWDTECRREVARYGPLNQRVLGVRPIEIRRIVGSVAAAGAWNSRFQPRSDDPHVLNRFRNVCRAMRAGDRLQPITVYKLRRVYYVVDGRHRVGAARRLGWETIDATATVFVPSGDLDEALLFHQQQAFEAYTDLLLVEASRLGTYPALLAEIESYRQDCVNAGEIHLRLQEASMRWYYRCFLPAITLIRGSSARQFAPSLCSADILAHLLSEERRAATAPRQ